MGQYITNLFTKHKYVLRDSSWVLLWESFGFVFTFIISILFAHFLSKTEYGTYRYLIALSAIIGSFTLTGMGTMVTSAVAKGYEYSFISSIKYQLKFNILAFFVSFCIGTYYLYQGNTVLGIGSISIGMLTVILTSFNSFISYLNGKQQYKALFIVNVFISAISTLTTILVILFSGSALTLAIWTFGISAFLNALLTYIVFYLYKPNKKDDTSLFYSAIKLSAGNFLKNISSQVDRIALFQFSGAASLAIYNFSQALPDQIRAVQKIIPFIALPRFSKKDNASIEKNIYKQTLLLTFCVTCLVFLYIISAPLIFDVFFKTYSESIFYSQILAGVQILIAPTMILTTFLQSKGNQTKFLIFTGTVSLIDITVTLISIFSFGIIGAIFSKYIMAIINLLGILSLSKQEMKTIVK